MRFPFVSRARYDDRIAELEKRLLEKDERFQAADKERQRLQDIIFQQNLGMQVNGSFNPAVATENEAPEPQLTPEQQADKDTIASELRERTKLRLIARTRKSQLGPALEKHMQRKVQNWIRANSHPVHQIFAEAREEVLNTVNGNK